MISILNIGKVKYDEFDEVWAIVRSMKYENPRIKQVQRLSPSPELFHKYLNLKAAGNWNKESFDNIYVPKFLHDIRYGDERGFEVLNELYKLDKQGKKIALCCFCPEESLCHRSIVAGLLQAVGCNVVIPSKKDYSKYYDMYKSL